LWNLTTSTITGFQLSPVGQKRVGSEPDPERQGQGSRSRRAPAHHRRGARALRRKVGYAGARQCVVRDLEIKAGRVFSIADKDLKDCNK